ncbi:hypothetical protein [Propionivibrio sp.]|uniref:hypothetical protein n=1 Tax=Propionivibrio sp. TaxID=2212460 RepID=UPI003BF00E78
MRSEDVIHDDRSELQAEVLNSAFHGAEVLSLVPSHHNDAIGERIGIRLDVDPVVAFRTSASKSQGLRKMTEHPPQRRPKEMQIFSLTLNPLFFCDDSLA